MSDSTLSSRWAVLTPAGGRFESVYCRDSQNKEFSGTFLHGATWPRSWMTSTRKNDPVNEELGAIATKNEEDRVSMTRRNHLKDSATTGHGRGGARCLVSGTVSEWQPSSTTSRPSGVSATLARWPRKSAVVHALHVVSEGHWHRVASWPAETCHIRPLRKSTSRTSHLHVYGRRLG